METLFASVLFQIVGNKGITYLEENFDYVISRDNNLGNEIALKIIKIKEEQPLAEVTVISHSIFTSTL